jgi:L-aspartate oxidase
LQYQGFKRQVENHSKYFESHIKDTLSTGSHLGDEKAVRFMVENAPDAIASLEEIGVLFTQEDGQ